MLYMNHTFIVSIRGSKFWLLDGRTMSGGSERFLLSKSKSPIREHTHIMHSNNTAFTVSLVGKCF